MIYFQPVCSNWQTFASGSIDHSTATLAVGEGTGSANLDTDEVFYNLGYVEMAKKTGIELVDLNYGPTRKLENRRCPVFPEMYLPEIAFSHYIISLPVLKVHSLAQLTGTLKNMMGFAQPRYYSGQSGTWKKALFHEQIQQSIIDLNSYLLPNLSIMDCSMGMAEFHLGGAQCTPPVAKLIAGYNPYQVDQKAAELLGLDWSTIRHIAVGLQ